VTTPPWAGGNRGGGLTARENDGYGGRDDGNHDSTAREIVMRWWSLSEWTAKDYRDESGRVTGGGRPVHPILNGIFEAVRGALNLVVVVGFLLGCLGLGALGVVFIVEAASA
jgi:hypothetical protein